MRTESSTTRSWVDSEHASCIHPGAEPVRGTQELLRTWTVLMANIGYIQFFLTDINVVYLPQASEEPHTAIVTCTENILSEAGVTSREDFTGGKAVATSILVRDGGTWKFLMRHASPVADLTVEDEGEL